MHSLTRSVRTRYKSNKGLIVYNHLHMLMVMHHDNCFHLFTYMVIKFWLLAIKVDRTNLQAIKEDGPNPKYVENVDYGSIFPIKHKKTYHRFLRQRPRFAHYKTQRH